MSNTTTRSEFEQWVRDGHSPGVKDTSGGGYHVAGVFCNEIRFFLQTGHTITRTKSNRPGVLAWLARLAYRVTHDYRFINSGWEYVDTPEFAAWKAAK